MKNITKTLLGISAMLLPLSLIAGEIKYSQNEQTVVQGGLSINLTGIINKKQIKGETGTISIDGKNVFIDKHTFISNSNGIKIGEKVIVIAHHQYGKLFALSVN